MNAPESTLFNAVPVVSELNRVAGFDPLKFLKRLPAGMSWSCGTKSSGSG